MPNSETVNILDKTIVIIKDDKLRNIFCKKDAIDVLTISLGILITSLEIEIAHTLRNIHPPVSLHRKS